MFNWIKKQIARFRELRRLEREIDPESFRILARELRELALMAERLMPRHHKFHAKVKRIQTEMEELDRLISKPEFKRLSRQRRMQLRQSMIQSRDQIIETVKTAPAPTSMLQ